MKKVLLFFTTLLAVFTCFLFGSDSKCESVNNVSPLRNIEYNKEDIIYENGSSVEKTINDSISIQNISFTIKSIVDYPSYYGVDNYDGYSTYYVSDGIGINTNAIEIVGIIIIPNNVSHNYYYKNISNSFNYLEVLYYCNDELHIMFEKIQDDLVFYVSENCTFIYNINDESDLSTSILDILNYERHYYLEQLNVETINYSDDDLSSMYEEQNRSGYCNSAQTVSYQQYDNYASHKGALDVLLNDETARNEYKYYKHNFTDQTQATDSMIVDVIPRQLFTNVGIYSYIGTKYGFFVKTVNIYGDYSSDFIIFTVKQIKKNVGFYGMLEIKPAIKGFVDCPTMTNVVSNIIFGSRLVLTNINCNLSVCNKTEPNVGDSTYNANNDYGYYISGYKASYNFKYAHSSSLNLKYIRFALKPLAKIPKYGQLIKWTATGITYVIEGVYNSVNSEQIQQASLPSLNGNYETNDTWLNPYVDASQMISLYGALVKGINTNISDVSNGNDTSRMYYDVNNLNRFYIDYSLEHRDDNTIYDAYIETQISLSIGELSSNGNSLTIQDSVANSWAEEYNERKQSSTSTISLDQIANVEYDISQYQDFTFTPIFSGWYDIETFGTRYDTVLGLYQGNTLLKVDNNSGRYVFEYNDLFELDPQYGRDFLVDLDDPLCSLIHYNLTANTTYTIRVKGANNTAGFTNLIVKRSGDDLTELTSTSSYTTFSGYSQWQKFIPTRTDIYDILTFNHNDIVNTYIELYDRNHNRIKYNDDYDNTYHGKVSFYLEEDEIYFVRTWHSGADTSQRQFGVAVIKEEEIRNMSSNMQYETMDRIEKGFNDVIIYRFYPDYSSTYSFYTEYVSGKKDVVMYLFDSDFNQLAYNDDGNGNLQPLISYQCYNYKTYYIMIKQYSPSNGDYTWFYFNVED